MLYARAADAGHLEARVQLARMRLYGIAAPPNPGDAVRDLMRAEAAGHAGAACLLAMVALGGLALPRDGRINQRLLAAVDAGNPMALRAAAIHFGRKPDPGDQALCIRMLDAAAKAGDAVSAALLAERLAHGEGVDADPDAAADMLRQLDAQGIGALPACSAPMPVTPPSPPRQLAIEDAMQPAPATALSSRPGVAKIDGLLSRDECRLLMLSAQPFLRPSRAVDPDSGAAQIMPLRTSNDASFDPVLEDFALRCVQLRMARAAGMELVNAEQLIVLRYEPGQEYRPHRDYLPSSAIERDRPQAGNRARTICVYLNDVDAGGETAFPAAGVEVAPKAGSAVVFDNLRGDGSPDPDSLHAGQPVLRGVKWLATLWLRQGRYRAF
ncbi:MAG: 2OG-Fe(II) oxygenase [Luteimonas sp.]|nr:2OG-Fe(II) oxygenase [Luteimonas sp.]